MATNRPGGATITFDPSLAGGTGLLSAPILIRNGTVSINGGNQGIALSGDTQQDGVSTNNTRLIEVNGDATVIVTGLALRDAAGDVGSAVLCLGSHRSRR